MDLEVGLLLWGAVMVIEWYGVRCQRIELRDGVRISFDLIQSIGRRVAGCWFGLESICWAMIGRR